MHDRIFQFEISPNDKEKFISWNEKSGGGGFFFLAAAGVWNLEESLTLYFDFIQIFEFVLISISIFSVTFQVPLRFINNTCLF